MAGMHMLRFALAFLVGDIWVQSLPVLDLPHLLVPVVTAALLLALPLNRRCFSMPVIVAFLLGFVWTTINARAHLQHDLNPSLEGQDVVVTGHVASIPQLESYGVRFAFVVEHAAVGLPPRIELSWYEPAGVVHAGERWQLQVRLKRRRGFANPGGFDYEAALFREGIGATGYVRESRINRRLGRVRDDYVLKARAALTEAIAAAIPEAPMQGVVRGLAVGDQQAIGSAAWQVFARTGTSHLMAISGFHIGMVAWLFAWLGSRLVLLPAAQRRRWTAPDLRAIFGMSAALGYSLLAGMSVPTQRTLLMLAVYFGAGLLRREINVWQGFGLALLLVLLVDPFAPMAAGAWLSFGAVAVILLNQVGRARRASGWRGFLSMQLVVSVGMVPLLLGSFGSLSLVSPLVNLLAIPVFTAVLVPLVLIGCVLLVMHPALGGWWLQWVARALDYVFAGLQWAAGLPWANWYAPQADVWAMGLLVLGTIMMVLPWLWPLRVSGLCCCLPALCWQPAVLPEGGFTLTTLDVGQGLAVVVQTRTHALLYDTGPKFQSGRDTGELVVLPYLHAQGIRQLDVLMISHGDDDHAGGMHSVLTGLPVKQLLPGPSVAVAVQRANCQRGQHWQWDGVTFSVLHPGPGSEYNSDNNQSCVLRISAPGGSALLLGDVEKRIERELNDAGLIARTTVVEAAHHGSRSSSTEALINSTRPEWVVFSVGYRNRWGFPRPEVLADWRASGAQTESTVDAGAITLALLPDRPVIVQRYREQRRRYWHTQ
jgi:competence protein ComEC